MARRYTIFFFLFVAYTVLQVHNVTPHFHLVTSADQHTHHHDHGTDHDHVHDHDHDNETDPEDNIFGHLEHTGFAELQYINAPKVHQSAEQQAQDYNAVVQEIHTIIERWHAPPNIRPPLRSDQNIPIQSLAYFFPIKAPPAILPAWHLQAL